MPRQSAKNQGRSGATLVEAAFILPVFLTLVLGAFDLGMAVFHSHLLAAAARSAARQAVVRPLAAELGSWGPGTVGPLPGDATNPVVQSLRPCLAGLDPATVTVLVEWPDGGNGWGQRVRVTLSCNQSMALTYLFGDDPLRLRSSSTQAIAH